MGGTVVPVLALWLLVPWAYLRIVVSGVVFVLLVCGVVGVVKLLLEGMKGERGDPIKQEEVGRRMSEIRESAPDTGTTWHREEQLRRDDRRLALESRVRRRSQSDGSQLAP